MNLNPGEPPLKIEEPVEKFDRRLELCIRGRCALGLPLGGFRPVVAPLRSMRSAAIGVDVEPNGGVVDSACWIA